MSAIRKSAAPDRRAIGLISVLLGFESVLYSVVTPVLPHYAHEFAASKPAIGLLAASYPAGMLPGSVLGGWLGTRVGVRRTTVIGLLLFTAAIIPFGFGSSIIVLDALRFVQGIACGCIWGGGLAWVIAVAPRERRSEVLGSVLASAILGTLIGPLLGTAAVAAGTEVVFVCVGVVSFALGLWTLGFEQPPRTALGGAAPLRALISSRRLILGFWLVVLVAGTIGATGTLLPLRLSRFGASGIEIGITFVIASLLALVLTPWSGRLIDRRGVIAPLCVGLLTSAVLLALLPLPQGAGGLAVLTVLSEGGPLVAATMGALALMTDAVEQIGAAVAFGSMLMNIAWGLGETVGAPAAATLSRATSDAVPLLLLAGAMLATLAPVLVLRARRRAPAIVSSGSEQRSSGPAADRRASRHGSPRRSHPDRAAPAAHRQEDRR